MQPEKKQNQFSICFGKILPTQEIIHTRNEILSPAVGNHPNRKRLRPSLDLKNIVRKSRHCACLPHLVQRAPRSHQKFFSVLTQSLTFWRIMEVYNKRSEQFGTLFLGFLHRYTSIFLCFWCHFTQQWTLRKRGAEDVKKWPIIYFRGVRKLEDGENRKPLCGKKNLHTGKRNRSQADTR